MGRGLPALVACVLVALPGVASAQFLVTGTRASCGSCGGGGLNDALGGYSYIGGGTVDGVPALEFASGTGHAGDFGTEFSGFLGQRGLLLALTMRAPILRAGLDDVWTGTRAPATAFVLTPRFGVATAASFSVSTGAYLGIDGEFLLLGQLLVAIRSGVYVPFDRDLALVRPFPLVSVAFGFAPGSAYGWEGP